MCNIVFHWFDCITLPCIGRFRAFYLSLVLVCVCCWKLFSLPTTVAQTMLISDEFRRRIHELARTRHSWLRGAVLQPIWHQRWHRDTHHWRRAGVSCWTLCLTFVVNIETIWLIAETPRWLKISMRSTEAWRCLIEVVSGILANCTIHQGEFIYGMLFVTCFGEETFQMQNKCKT